MAAKCTYHLDASVPQTGNAQDRHRLVDKRCLDNSGFHFHFGWYQYISMAIRLWVAYPASDITNSMANICLNYCNADFAWSRT